ncbi:MAG: AAA family ATPase, partial [Lachnospiraceae bacterium]|nr:AAA family ATPase [Lachnospiraceae bacterium]
MKLISCYISGFGRMADQSFDFREGLNQVMENNGWGKTTLTVFLKAMFYGLEYSPRKNALSDREHYKPWGGGTYGGSLSIRVGHKSYRIERTFGEKDKEDT